MTPTSPPPSTTSAPAPRVGVFGMGLVGGSIALGLRERGLASEVVGYDPDPEALASALAVGAVDRVAHAIDPWVHDLDLGILAAPALAVPSLGATLAPFAAPTSRWIDVASTKADIVAALEPLLPNFVGTHPMAGSERAGVQHAYAGMLKSAIWVLCPTTATPPAAMGAAEALVTALGAYPLTLAPDAHDRAVARISHLPWLLSVALNLELADAPDAATLLALAAGGFRDLTRVASGAPGMSRDMAVSNAAELRVALADLSTRLGSLMTLLSNPPALLAEAQRAKRTRDSLPIVQRSLLPRFHDVMVGLDDRPLELARLTTVLGEAGINIRDIEVLKIRDGGEAIRVGVASDTDLEAARAALSAAGYRWR